jgi:hypothetical protein
VLLPVVALTPLGAALLLLPFQQLAEPRYFSIALVAGMAVACAQALTWRAGRAALWTSALVLLSLSTTLTAVRARPSTEAEDWTPAARAVVADAQPGDRLVFAQPYARIPFAIAAQDAGIMRAMPATAVPSTPLAATDPFAFSNASLDVNRLAARAELTGVQRVWYVTRTNDVLLPTVLPAVLLEQGFVPRSYTQVYGVRVDLLERAPTGVALP